MNEFALGVKTQVFNHELRSRREKMGLSQYQLEDACNLTRGTISQIETFKEYPSFEKLETIAEYLNTTINILFPEWLREQRLKKSSYSHVVMVEKISLETPEVNLLEAPDDIANLAEQSIMRDEIEKALEGLTFREQKIIKMRFGLEDGKTHSLGEVGQEFAATRERIRQIEAKTMHKLREYNRKNDNRLEDLLR